MTQTHNTATVPPNAPEWRKRLAALANMAAVNTAHWMVQNRKHYPAFFFHAGAVAFGIVIACVALSVMDQYAVRVAIGAVMQAGVGVCTITFVVVMLTMTAGAYRGATEMIANWQPATDAAALPETVDTWTMPDIKPDILVCLLPGETQTTFAQRLNDIKDASDITHAVWALVVPFRQEHVMIMTGGNIVDRVFTRGNEPFFDEPQSWAGQPDHTTETVAQYRLYVEWVAYHFSRWASAEKLSAQPDRATKTFIEGIAAQAEFSN